MELLGMPEDTQNRTLHRAGVWEVLQPNGPAVFPAPGGVRLALISLQGGQRMNLKNVLRRISQGVLIYIVIIFIYSAAFHTYNEVILGAEINDYVLHKVQRYVDSLTAEELESLQADLTKRYRQHYHLDEPLMSRIFWQAWRLIRFDLGHASGHRAFSRDSRIKTIIFERIPRTLALFLPSTIIAVFIGTILGIKNARRPNKLLDRTTTLITMIMTGIPIWWLSLILIMALSYGLGFFPPGGMHRIPPLTGWAYVWDMLWHMVLPLLVMTVFGLWGHAYMTRNIMLGTLQNDFITSVRARGLPDSRVLYHHALRTASPPIATMTAASVIAAFSGNVFFECVFNWPGLGSLYKTAVDSNDVQLLLGCLTATTLITQITIIITDILYGYLDPRIRSHFCD